MKNQKRGITRLDIKLLQEILCKLEDKINIMMDSIADHDAEIIRLNKNHKTLEKSLDSIKSQMTKIAKNGNRK